MMPGRRVGSFAIVAPATARVKTDRLCVGVTSISVPSSSSNPRSATLSRPHPTSGSRGLPDEQRQAPTDRDTKYSITIEDLVVEEAARLLDFFGAEARIFDPSDLPFSDQVKGDDHAAIRELRELSMWTT